MRTLQICFLFALFVLVSSRTVVSKEDIVSLATAPSSAPFSSPPAPPPAPSYVNVTSVLEQAGQFKTFLSLLKGTQVETQLQTQANNTQQGLTLFAPSDSAFAALRPKTRITKLTDAQKTSLVEYHAVPNFYTLGQFQSLSNPISTMSNYKFNVTAFGAQVNMSTGLVTAPITSSIFSQTPVAVYEIDKVLLPEEIFGLPSPTPAPSPEPVAAPASALSPSQINSAKSPLAGSGSSDQPNVAPSLNTKDLLIHLVFIMFGALAVLLTR